MITQEMKIDYVNRKDVTLDGEPAQILGAKLDWPYVVSKNKSVEFCWSTIQFVLQNKNGKFRS